MEMAATTARRNGTLEAGRAAMLAEGLPWPAMVGEAAPAEAVVNDRGWKLRAESAL
jgi:hypothetical protein